MTPYDHERIEAKQQRAWARKKLYKTSDKLKAAQKQYILDMFPYPSGEGLHVGHPKGYIATDVYSRMKRMQGFEVLHPMGFDAFGLPAENYAIKTKTNPIDSVKKNVARYKKQLEILGLDYDWSREINTTDPAYYKWTQWIFLKMLEKGLAYESYEPINWCPSCKTGLANEDVEDGKCERCGTVVEKKPMRQWVLKITDYAERMLEDLDKTTLNIPLIERTEGADAVKAGLPLEERNAAVAIVKHWSEDKYLCSFWKKNDWKGFVIGGIETGEAAGAAAVREVAEETGYTSAKFVREVGKVRSRFYHAVKKVNRHANFTAVYLELQNGDRSEMAAEESALHDVVWLSKSEVAAALNRDDMRYLWDLFTGSRKQEPKPLLDWPNSIKESQRNWIGKSEGALFKFKVQSSKLKVEKEIEVFTTRPDTLFGVTYVVLAPEHKLVEELLGAAENKQDVIAYVAATKAKTLIERTDVKREKTGVVLSGISAVNPANGEKVPVWVADYVLADYGTGAVMAVPAHDERDFAFAKKFELPIKAVVFDRLAPIIDNTDKANLKPIKLETISKPISDDTVTILSAQAQIYAEQRPVTSDGVLVNSGQFSGMNSEEAKSLIANKFGSQKTTFKLKDWVFSRQRYWGEPIPVIHCEKCGVVPVPEKDLPVKLPKVKFYEPTGTGESPLAAIEKWVNVKCPKCRGKAKRETNTMPQWAGSSWYYLRYMDPKNKKALVDPKKEKFWAPVDFYVGGAEHATRHLIYARFWHKFLFDIGVVSTEEPFAKLQHVGLIMAEDGRKMSKRFGNVVNPDEVVKRFGADTLRVYEMFMGPFDQSIAWSTDNMVGSRRFIERVWKLADKVSKIAKLSNESEIELNKTIKTVGEHIADFRFNTAVSAMMVLLNTFEKETAVPADAYKKLLAIFAPFAPHVADERWGMTGGKGSIHRSPWPQYDHTKLVADTVTLAVMINGKTRATVAVSRDANEVAIRSAALSLPEVTKWLEGREPKKVIVVPGKIVSVVV